jgi:hypothetical protein
MLQNNKLSGSKPEQCQKARKTSIVVPGGVTRQQISQFLCFSNGGVKVSGIHFQEGPISEKRLNLWFQKVLNVFMKYR